MHGLKTRVAVLLAAAALAVGCGDDPTPIPPGPSVPTITETFEGTLNPFSARTFLFEAQNAGAISVALVAVDPADSIVGLSLGTAGGTTCQAAVSTEFAFQGFTLNGLARTVGIVCARIYDSSENGLAAPVPFTLSVTHF